MTSVFSEIVGIEHDRTRWVKQGVRDGTRKGVSGGVTDEPRRLFRGVGCEARKSHLRNPKSLFVRMGILLFHFSLTTTLLYRGFLEVISNSE